MIKPTDLFTEEELGNILEDIDKRFPLLPNDHLTPAEQQEFDEWYASKQYGLWPED